MERNASDWQRKELGMGPAKFNYFEEDPYYEMMRGGRDMDRKPKVAPKLY